jgi:hypothetical protein
MVQTIPLAVFGFFPVKRGGRKAHGDHVGAVCPAPVLRNTLVGIQK